MSELLSTHLSVAEYVATSHRDLVAAQEGAWISNPTFQRNAERLARDVFEPVRAVLHVPLVVTSGFRCRMLNDSIGGKPHSLHLEALAIDVIPVGLDPRVALFAVLHAMKRGQLPAIDRIIVECNRWLHIQAARTGVAPSSSRWSPRTDGSSEG